MKKRTGRRLTAALLAFSMIFAQSPQAVFAEGESGNLPQNVADTGTLTEWESVFGTAAGEALSTKDIGRIWNDKTVSTDNVTLSGDIGESVTIQKEEGADFLLGLSSLGSAATIVDSTAVPTDTVFVLDLSHNMMDNNNKASAMVNAANDAIHELMNANEQNRVAVVGFSNEVTTLLPLDHYDNTGEQAYLTYSENGLFEQQSISSNGIREGENPFTETVSDPGSVSKWPQLGIYTGMDLLNRADTTAQVGEKTVTRAPVMIFMAEGEAKMGSTIFINPANGDIEENIAGRNTSRYAQSFVAAMTAAYMKEQVTKHYYGEGANSEHTARIYTIGVNTSGAEAAAIAYAYLDPAQTEPNNFSNTGGNRKEPTPFWTLNYFNEKLSEYNANGNTSVWRYSNAGGNLGWESATISKSNNNNIEIESIAYNDQFYEVSDANWSEIFEQIADEVITNAPQSPTETEEGAEGSGGSSGYITFNDTLGAYMEVTGMPQIVYAGTPVTATESSTSGNTTTYTFNETVEGNEVYGPANLSNISLAVTKDDTTGRQTLTWKVPANLIPLRTMRAESTTGGSGEPSYTIQLEKEAYPIRLFYSVKRNTENRFTAADNDYLGKYSTNGVTNYYSNAWDVNAEDKTLGTTTAVFTPAATNAFYYYTEDTPLYVLQNVNGQDVLSAAEAKAHPELETIEPGMQAVKVDGQSYKVTAATGEIIQTNAYYYAHVYYQETTKGSAEKLTDYHLVQDNSRFNNDNVIKNESGRLYIKKGTNKLSRVNDANRDKEENATGTATSYRTLSYELNESENDHSAVTVYLGNNGLHKETTPEGTLTVTLGETKPKEEGGSLPEDAEQQTFTYTLKLYNVSDNTVLEGEYLYEIVNGNASATGTGNQTIESGGTFTLGKGQSIVIYGLPAGSAYILTETKVNGYIPEYTGETVQQPEENDEGGYYGQIRYREEGNPDPYVKVTVSHTYDASVVSASLRYMGNAQSGGTVNGLPNPPGISGTVGQAATLSQATPKHTEVNDKAVVFIGWSEERTTKIYGLEDQEEYEAFAAENEIYDPGDEFTFEKSEHTLYAVWGYDTTGTGTPDVTETVYTLTYDANGGYFENGEESVATRSVATVATSEDKKYSLDQENVPKHEAASDGTAVVFIGWVTEDKRPDEDTIYGIKNITEMPATVGEIAIKDDITVYAVWGYDTNEDGKPDINDTTYTINASVKGSGGTIDPEGEVRVLQGASQTFTFTANEGCAVDTVKIDDKTYTNNGSAVATPSVANRSGGGWNFETFTFTNVTEDHTISVSFAEDKDGDGKPDKYDPKEAYTIEASAGTNGKIAPSGSVAVSKGENQKFTFTPDKGYAVDTVTIDDELYVNDGGSEGPGQNGSWEAYTFKDVQAAHEISVTFGPDEDGNGVPDENEGKEPEEKPEGKYTLTYHANAQKDAEDADVSGVPEKSYHDKDETVLLADGSVMTHPQVTITKTVTEEAEVEPEEEAAEEDETLPADEETAGSETDGKEETEEETGGDASDEAETDSTDGESGTGDDETESGTGSDGTETGSPSGDTAQEGSEDGNVSDGDGSEEEGNGGQESGEETGSEEEDTSDNAGGGNDPSDNGNGESTGPEEEEENSDEKAPEENDSETGTGEEEEDTVTSAEDEAQSGNEEEGKTEPEDVSEETGEAIENVSGTDAETPEKGASEQKAEPAGEDGEPSLFEQFVSFFTGNKTGEVPELSEEEELQKELSKDLFRMENAADILYDDVKENEKNGQKAGAPKRETKTVETKVTETVDVLFIGWSEEKTGKIFDKGDFAELEKVKIVPAVTFEGKDIDVYAVWGYDEDGNGEPDVVEGKLKVSSYAGAHGRIAPDGTQWLEEGEDQRFRISPDEKYAVHEIFIDGEIYINDGETEAPGESWTEYTFEAVEEDHLIGVTFAEDKDGNGIPDEYEGEEEKPDPGEEDDEKEDGNQKGGSRNKDVPVTDYYTVGIHGNWVKVSEGIEAPWLWRFVLNDRSMLYGKWAHIDNPYAVSGQPQSGWFRFDENGYMLYGWYAAKAADGAETWYYLHGISDGMLGTMTEGWHQDEQDGKWYYLEPGSGRMLTGWQEIGGKWYYLNPSAPEATWRYDEALGMWLYEGSRSGLTPRPYGSMYQNEMTPDGYYVDGNGAWVKAQ